MFNLPDPDNTAELPHERTFPDALRAAAQQRPGESPFMFMLKETAVPPNFGWIL